jgi:predicted HTH transcriptional regulator
MKQHIFISSVQKEFAGERQALKSYILGDALLSRFFDVFLFEDIPAKDRRADAVYIEEVHRCDIYLALLGNQYGEEDAEGLSATHREFNEATRLGKLRLVFVKGGADADKHPKMRALIEAAGVQLIRRRFATIAELLPAVYASFVDYLAVKELLRVGPFDAAVCLNATINDLSAEKIKIFVGIASRARAFPLAEDTATEQVLEHLNLLNKGRPTNAAILLFGNSPQRFLISSEIKCAHFHGTEISKPIPFYQVYKGTAFDLVDQAVDFVLSKINLAVGTREQSVQAPVAYEMPPEVIREAIVNAVAHRDYTSNGSIQVMLFSDRLEVWNPGSLPPSLTLEKLRHPHGSVPGNPLLAEPLYLTKYIERMGTGTGDMIARCRKAGLPEPEFALTDGFVTTVRRKPELAFEAVGGQTEAPSRHQAGTKLALSGNQVEILRNCRKEKAIKELMELIGRSDRTKFRKQVLNPLLEDNLLEMTVPDKPSSSIQKYRLTPKGDALLDVIAQKGKKK